MSNTSMRLRSGCNFWAQVNEPMAAYERLERDLRCHVAIIGGGITGALVAYHLVQEGIDAVLVEAGQVAMGSTAASTGLLQYEIDVRLTDLCRLIGPDKAAGAYRASLEALEAFEPLVAELGDRCGLTPRGSLYLATVPQDVDALRAEQEARRAIGIDVDFLTAADLRERFAIERPAALWSPRAFEIDPCRLTRRLIQRVVERGLRVFESTRVVRYVADGDNDAADTVTLHVENGSRLQAGRVVFATGYATPRFFPRDICRLRSTYALVTEPLETVPPGWQERCLIWESGRPYFYLRSTPDGRAMCGGEDDDFADPARRDGLTPVKADILLRKMAALLPGLEAESACAWAGTFAETRDGLPYIGSIAEFPRGHFALGYGGNGITFSLLAARIIRDGLLGRPHPTARLFAFDRA